MVLHQAIYSSKHVSFLTRDRLRRKFNCLCNEGFSLSQDSSPVTIQNSNFSRLSIIGDVDFSLGEKTVLHLGPSFSASNLNFNSTLLSLKTEFQKTSNRLRSMFSHQTHNVQTAHQMLQSAAPFPKRFTSLPIMVPSLEPRLVSIWNQINKCLVDHTPATDNLSPCLRSALKSLIKRRDAGEIRISVSDKGGEFVVMPAALDREITLLHLSDTSIYVPSSKKSFTQKSKNINTIWDTVCKNRNFSAKFKTQFSTPDPVPPVLYTLVKTHKLSNVDLLKSSDPKTFKIRPIISSCGGPADKISWLLVKLLSPILTFIPAHLTNTKDFYNRLSSLPNSNFTENYCSFDVESLYTNVDIQSAIQAVIDLVSSHISEINLYGFDIRDIKLLLEGVLEANVFQWSGQYYEQILGLAMGNRMAPICAIAFMHKIETNVFLTIKPLFYVRYIDDTFIITGTSQELEQIFELFNNQNKNIKLTQEKPTSSGLPFLDTKISIENNTFKSIWYRKPTNKNILLHAKSAHPSSMKYNVIVNMRKTAENNSLTTEAKLESKQLVNLIAKENGYHKVSFKKPKTNLNFKQGHANLQIPFISDRFSNEIGEIIKKSGLPISVIPIPPKNLKHILSRSRLYDTVCDTKDCIICPNNSRGDCMRKGVIYCIICECGKKYIGETGRSAAVRIKEHIRAKNNPSCQSYVDCPLAIHRVKSHAFHNPEVSVKILAKETKTDRRKILEALFIREEKPELNNKLEMDNLLKLIIPTF